MRRSTVASPISQNSSGAQQQNNYGPQGYRTLRNVNNKPVTSNNNKAVTHQDSYYGNRYSGNNKSPLSNSKVVTIIENASESIKM